jgi:C-terminal processing protease CtpA/Prc
VWIDPISTITPRAYNRSGLDLQKDSPQSFIVTKVMPESAATVAGIKPRDRILSINGHPASQLGRTDVLVTFAGPAGSDVDVLVVPKEGGKAQSQRLRLKEMIN